MENVAEGGGGEKEGTDAAAADTVIGCTEAEAAAAVASGTSATDDMTFVWGVVAALKKRKYLFFLKKFEKSKQDRPNRHCT